ncbi:hypothetical protein SDC9_60856 [bioreactor metagenome]|uniref:Uncharacterized protein n=1 Tax=bioreactor metagenome TaxID=1076179 RepID=A0A644XE75_9ZZZZ
MKLEFNHAMTINDKVMRGIAIADVKLFRKVVDSIIKQCQNEEVEAQVFVYNAVYKEINLNELQVFMNCSFIVN